MLTYIGRRILQMIPVFIGVTILLFILSAPGVLPGRPGADDHGRAGHHSSTVQPDRQGECARQTALLSVLALGRTYLFQGTWGSPTRRSRPVTSILLDNFPNTFKLALIAILDRGSVRDCLLGYCPP